MNNMCKWGSCYKDSLDCLSYQLLLVGSRMIGEKNPSLSIRPQTGKLQEDYWGNSPKILCRPWLCKHMPQQYC